MSESDDTLRNTIAELEGTLASERPPRGRDQTGRVSKLPAAGTDRYTLGAQLGRGQHGVVHVAEDKVLRRRVAMKLVSESYAHDEDAIARFVAEAQVTAQIEHPHIVPIHDAGRWLDGRPFYTMPLLPGGSLAERLDAIRDGTSAEPLVRLVRWFSSTCMAVHAAHRAGVVHRDLKPGNFVLGPTGELLVADFGLARVSRDNLLVKADGPLERTRIGTPIGTPYYMPPEQARGDLPNIGPWSDVYSLGAILYEILTLRPPFLAHSFAELIVSILEAPPEPPKQARDDREVPRDLAALALRCLEKDPALRPTSAAELVEVIDGWLEGRFESERRRAAVADLLASARDARARADERAAAISERRRGLVERWASTPDHAPVTQKEPLWAEEEVVSDLERIREGEEGTAITALEAALRLAPSSAEVREELASLHLTRRSRYAARGQRDRAIEDERRAIAAGGAAVAERLNAAGTLVVRSSFEVALAQYVEERGRLRLRGLRDVALDVPHRLAPGSYRMQAEVGGRVAALPFQLSAGEALTISFDVEALASLPMDMVLVHGGASIVGGDEGDAHAVEVGSFALSVYPVTCGEYLEFLRSGFERVEDALRRAPRPAHDAAPYWRVMDGVVQMPSVDGDGDRWDARYPVFGVSLLDALEFIAWRGARDGRTYRLPTEHEYERAARGADGRKYPWGDRFDPSLCKMRASRAGDFTPEVVGAFSTDVSPFGVRDLAGGIAEWTSSPYGDDPRARCVKGGAWSTRAHRCAASFRASMFEHHVSGDLGFRLGCDVSLPERG